MILRRPLYVIDVSGVTRVIKLDADTWLVREQGLYAETGEYRIVSRADLADPEADYMGDGNSIHKAEAVHARETGAKIEDETPTVQIPF
jgi:hypothetical protein